MTKHISRWFLIVVSIILLIALATLVLIVTQALQNNSASFVGVSTQVSTGYPGPTEKIQATSTRELDVSTTLAWLQTQQPIPTTSYPVGIFTEGLAEYSKMGFDIKNGWRGELGGYPIRAAAGSLVSDSRQGIVLVSWDLPGLPNAGIYKSPKKAGSVEIVNVTDGRLILRAEEGSMFYFDLPGQSFVASLDERVPTVTPRPSLTPVMPADIRVTNYPPNLAPALVYP